MQNDESCVKSVSQFLECCKSIRKGFGFKPIEIDPWNPWFRGHKNADWELQPKLYREYGGFQRVKKLKIEDEMREEFITRAPSLCEHLSSSEAERAEWEWCFIMQHHGAPTRLLDWTDASLIALYFAVKDNRGLCPAAVWALNPYELNRRAIGGRKPQDELVYAPSATGILDSDRKRTAPWLPQRFTKMHDPPKKPIAVFPTHVVRRMSTQRSCFTIHGTDEKGLERLRRQKPCCLVKLVIPAWRVIAIRRELEAAGIDETTVYPDLEGLSRTISLRWQPDTPPQPHKKVYTRLRPSKIHKGGVGVFALTPIKKGELLFYGDNEEMRWVKERDVPKSVF